MFQLFGFGVDFIPGVGEYLDQEEFNQAVAANQAQRGAAAGRGQRGAIMLGV